MYFVYRLINKFIYYLTENNIKSHKLLFFIYLLLILCIINIFKQIFDKFTVANKLENTKEMK